ncbi:thermonuclease family protein [Seohaeicola sp. SP36]|uniref:thermonuclease family protein n=1 Tax=unclassified Seohaeicola TaxID=2641111 RepID=UPI00237AAE06|nr:MULTISPECIES: thermonuclease family protein [unclassified Seohaeicola]MDD9708097.1 thermonuclease family protein [Seohaeicola sp. 4SK31]MDD9736061.1 thermonuclease family protein [Seohaeicola sp. SP36]
MSKILFLFLLAVGLLTASFVLAESPRGVIRVIDGDTLDVGGTRVRLHGIDAPEADQTCETDQGRSWTCGAWVSREVRARYQGKTARCEAVDRDRYGRIVARCAVNGQDMGAALVAEGLAFAYRRYSMDYDLIEKQAAAADRGLWTMQVENPATFRQQGQAAQPAPKNAAGDCNIKGNVNAKGERIFHRPGQEHYDRTRINTGQGERWFCSAAEAEAAGWRAARR